YKRLKGFNVLHPMGYDSFGLPAEQYAIQTGQHPAITTEKNIARYREQMDKIGFSFDWEREVRTSDPSYYKWTQWIFIQLFNSWYNNKCDKAEKMETLIAEFEKNGNANVNAVCDEEVKNFSAADWKNFSEKERSDMLMHYRLAYLGEAIVNWCPQLGTVLANEEVKDGVSERGGYPVERRSMPQWSLRITAYAERLLTGLEDIDWSEAIKEQQRNWIGRSYGCSIRFKSLGGKSPEHDIEVFTTRPDTLFGVSYLTLAPEHPLVEKITPPTHRDEVNAYVAYAKNRSERERMADVKKVTGVFTGHFVIHPFTKEKIQVWIGDYVLAGYGTGAVMAVPAHDERDHTFARHFGLPLKQVIELPEGWNLEKASYDEKKGKVINSDFLDGLEVEKAIEICISKIEENNFGKGKVNYRLRDAIFGRQRYWGEPIPVYYENGIPKTMEEKDLPLELPKIDKFLPTETGEPPLARAQDWKYKGKYEYEKTTMPGWAGSSWYYLRYMDPHNDTAFAGKEALEYWKDVDLYIGGAEHATGHLLYVRFWTKFLKDLGYISIEEPARKLINQGMIQGRSNFVYRVAPLFVWGANSPEEKAVLPAIFVTKSIRDQIAHGALDEKISNEIHSTGISLFKKLNPGKEFLKFETIIHCNDLHVDVSLVNNDILDIDKYKKWSQDIVEPTFYNEPSGEYICGWEVEKMSKSKFNVVSPDDICNEYGADCLRLYEMFLGPLEQSKPWNTNGITGVYNFLKKLWKLYEPFTSPLERSSPANAGPGEAAPSKQELKILHKTIKKVQDDIDRFSFNTSVSNFMICVNELTDLKCNKRAILEPLTIVIAPYAPHIAEELWEKLGHKESITYAQWPALKEEYLVESAFNYPVSFNGKTRFFHEFDLSLSKEDIEKEVLALEDTRKYLEGKSPKKIIVVPGRIVNIVV
ncbi:MAG TPA: class I tRNA ligase family protein, partial [Bacteroidia bacterium]